MLKQLDYFKQKQASSIAFSEPFTRSSLVHMVGYKLHLHKYEFHHIDRKFVVYPKQPHFT